METADYSELSKCILVYNLYLSFFGDCIASFDHSMFQKRAFIKRKVEYLLPQGLLKIHKWQAKQRGLDSHAVFPEQGSENKEKN